MKKRIYIIDAPGHSKYISNMMDGLIRGDVAVLVISSKNNEFEAGFINNGQTREHIILSKSMGIRHIICLVNKMDDKSVNWDKKVFDNIVNQLGKYLIKHIGFNGKNVTFIPVSGLMGVNIVDNNNKGLKLPEEAKWVLEYSSLMHVVNHGLKKVVWKKKWLNSLSLSLSLANCSSQEAKEAQDENRFKCIIYNCYKDQQANGVIGIGRILQGFIDLARLNLNEKSTSTSTKGKQKVKFENKFECLCLPRCKKLEILSITVDNVVNPNCRLLKGENVLIEFKTKHLSDIENGSVIIVHGTFSHDSQVKEKPKPKQKQKIQVKVEEKKKNDDSDDDESKIDGDSIRIGRIDIGDLLEVMVNVLPSDCNGSNNSHFVISNGFESMFHCHFGVFGCEIIKLKHLLHPQYFKNGLKSKNAPSILRKGQSGIVIMKLTKKLCFDEKDDSQSRLAKFALRRSTKEGGYETICHGAILRVI